MPCAACGNADTVKFGVRILQRMTLAADGSVRREPESMQRYRCKSCGHAFSHSPDDDAVVDTVCDSALRFGLTRAAERHHLDTGTVSRIVSRWIERQQDDLDNKLPDVLVIHPLRSREPPQLILADAQEGGILEIVEGHHGLREYASQCDGSPSLIAIDIDAALASVISSKWPQANLTVPPSAAARAIGAASLMTFREMVREGVAKGRNFRERSVLLRKRDEDLTPGEKDELEMWSDRLRRFRSAVQLLLRDLATASLEQFSDGLKRVQNSLKTLAPNGALDHLLNNWEKSISLGVAQRWLDSTWEALDTLRREVTATKPSSGLDVLRAILVFSVPREVFPSLRHDYPGIFRSNSGRRTFEGAMDALRRFS